jgi:triphosphoribosyl-dephospho-CoA synthase
MSMKGNWTSGYSVGRIAELACLLEVTASKPGNVHRGADFEDVSFVDFAASAVAMGQAIDDSVEFGYGETVLTVARKTTDVVRTNTNLGINLLVSYLAWTATTYKKLDRDTIVRVQQFLTDSDAELVYQAIRLMNPGGLGTVENEDVGDSPTNSLLHSMSLAKDHDRIAAQYSNGFEDVLDKALPWIIEGREIFLKLMPGIVWAHVRMMSEYPDSLIARKCGDEVAEKSQALASQAIESLDDGPESFFAAVSNLDFWLRSDGHRRNPGTTADLIAAGLFVGLYNEEISPPF